MNNHFTIVMTGRNSVPYINKSIESALNQDYDDYEIIVMDAESDDGSYAIAQEYEYRNSRKMSVIRNDNRKYQGENILIATKLAISNSIIVTLDSDDHFPHQNVLSTLNKIYDNDTMMSYGGSYIHSDGRDVRSLYEAYPQEVIKNNSYRDHRWLGSHIRSFRRELFLKIEVDDLKDSTTNDFYSMAPDLTFMWPMLEMAQERSKYVNDVLYVYNVSNPQNESKINQSEIDRIEKEVRTKKRYSRTESL